MALIPPTRQNLAGLSQREIEYLEILAAGGNDAVDTIDEVANLLESVNSIVGQNTARISELQNSLNETISNLNDLANYVYQVLNTRRIVSIGQLSLSAPDTLNIATGASYTPVTVIDTIDFNQAIFLNTVASSMTVQANDIYFYQYALSLEAPSNNLTIELALLTDGVVVNGSQSSQIYKNSTDQDVQTGSGYARFAAGSVNQVGIRHDSGGSQNIGFETASFTMQIIN